MTTYRGFEVLEVEPDWPDDRSRGYTRKLVRLDNGMAPIQVSDVGGRNFGNHAYRWWCGSRAEAQAMRSFLAARRGQSVPFWLPTWTQDFTLSQQANSSDQGLIVTWRAYTDRMWPDMARRDIVIMLPSGPIYRRITSSSQTSSTETLTLSATLGATVPVGTLVCFLTFCRLGTDEPEITWESQEFATCDLPVIEIPREVP